MSPGFGPGRDLGLGLNLDRHFLGAGERLGSHRNGQIGNNGEGGRRKGGPSAPPSGDRGPFTQCARHQLVGRWPAKNPEATMPVIRAGYRAGCRDAGRFGWQWLSVPELSRISPGPRPVALIVITRQDGTKFSQSLSRPRLSTRTVAPRHFGAEVQETIATIDADGTLVDATS